MSIQDFVSLVAETFKEEEALWTPGFWYLTTSSMVEIIRTEEPGLVTSPYDVLKSLIHRITKLWSMNYDKWEVDSLEKLLTKTSAMLGGTYKTLLNSETAQNAILYMSISLSREPLFKEACLDMSLRTIMSTSSTIVPSAAPCASVIGVGTSHAASFDLATEENDPWANSGPETGTMPSFITFFKNQERKKFGFVGPPKDFKISLKLYDLTKCSGDLERYWTGTHSVVDMTVALNSKIMQMVKDLQLEMRKDLQANGAEEMPQETGKTKTGNGFKRKYQPY